MPNLLPYYQVKLTLCRCMSYFINNPPKAEDEKFAYAIIQKAYYINENNSFHYSLNTRLLGVLIKKLDEPIY